MDALNLAMFLARYPEFSSVSPTLLQAYFLEAQLYYNRPGDPALRQQLCMMMLTAHVGFLAGCLSADGQARPVGRVSQAGEGSVSATFEMEPPAAGTRAWYNQTQYGASFLAATSKARGMTYITQIQGQQWLPNT
jgi:hypothetical protein